MMRNDYVIKIFKFYVKFPVICYFYFIFRIFRYALKIPILTPFIIKITSIFHCISNIEF